MRIAICFSVSFPQYDLKRVAEPYLISEVFAGVKPESRFVFFQRVVSQ